MTEAIWKSWTFRKWILSLAGMLLLTLGGLWLVDRTRAEPPAPAASADNEKSSDSTAEAVARLQHSIQTQRKYLENLNARLDDPNSEFHRAEKRFERVDAEREAARKAIKELKGAGKAAEAAKREAALKEIEQRWQQNRERFDLAIKERKALQENIAAAKRQLRLDRQALNRLSNALDDPGAAGKKDSSDSAAPAPVKSPPSPSDSPARPAVPKSPLSIASSTAADKPKAAKKAKEEHVSPEVERARQEAKLKEQAAKKAEAQAKSITERVKELKENIAEAQTLLEAARQRADREEKTKAELEGELRQKRVSKAPEAELQELSRRIAAAQKRFDQARGEVRSTTDHLHDLHSELTQVQAAQIRALRAANADKEVAEAAEKKVAELQNPFRPRNIAYWLLHHGPRLLLVAAGMFFFYRLSRVLSRRIVQFMLEGTGKRGSRQDRENRAQTLVGVFNSALSLLILGGGTLMLLEEAGIPIVPLMGGAAVVGLAVAFGAQNLIKDYFSGFMVLLEDQYGINDVVKIGPISGLVEHISLRTTVLRDLEGIVHFIPHGTITTVSNMTHGWSRALFDVGIDYKENVDRVMGVLMEIGHEMRRDAAFGPLILDDPEMLGVDQFSDSSVIIKFFMKTRPLQQWTVKREMLRRIKKRFDELGIEIPYPHQTVHHRYDSPPPGGAPESLAAAPGRRVA